MGKRDLRWYLRRDCRATVGASLYGRAIRIYTCKRHRWHWGACRST